MTRSESPSPLMSPPPPSAEPNDVTPYALNDGAPAPPVSEPRKIDTRPSPRALPALRGVLTARSPNPSPFMSPAASAVPRPELLAGPVSCRIRPGLLPDQANTEIRPSPD